MVGAGSVVTRSIPAGVIAAGNPARVVRELAARKIAPSSLVDVGMSSERNLRGERVLITGGAGMIGSHIADLVVEQEAREIVVLDDFVRGRRENLGMGAWPTATSRSSRATSATRRSCAS